MHTPDDAHPYTAGVDRSATEVAALFLADHPDGDPVAFLCGALGLDEQAALDAVALIAEPATEPGADDDQADSDDSDDAAVDEDQADSDDAGAAATKAALLERAAELGVEVNPRWGVARIRDALGAAG